MTFLIEEGKMLKGKYTQLRLAPRFGGINTIEFTQSLCFMLKSRPHIQAHLVLPTLKANAEKPKEPDFLPTLDRKLIN